MRPSASILKDGQMKILLPNLFEGHAPITLQNAFHEALDALDSWQAGAEEPLVTVDGCTVPISHVFARMSGCTDLMPRRTRTLLETIASGTPAQALNGSLFSDGVMLVMPLCVECLALASKSAPRPPFETADLSCAGMGG
jgi:hypothetical protein